MNLKVALKSILLICFLTSIYTTVNSQITVTEMATMPFPVSNNAFTLADSSGIKFLYSFGGIDSTKIYSGIHLSSYRYNTLSDTWDTLPDLPDSQGKIAAGASTVKNKIYVIGGYHVQSNGNEISSNKVHVFDPQLNDFLADGSPIPVPIDDHVQTVWRDSLIYVITGWSNTTNVPNVQIYNPTSDVWSVGTSLPNTSVYKAFGATGTILGDTIYYLGGATTGINFPAQKTLRKGIIDPLNPTSITWSNPTVLENMYRGVATSDAGNGIYFLGGSPISYNYNGIAYNGSGGVEPNLNYYYFSAEDPTNWYISSLVLPMDLRGIGEYSSTIKYIAGGMETGQKVSKKTLKLEITSNLSLENKMEHSKIKIIPNPVTDKLILQMEGDLSNYSKVIIQDFTGKIIRTSDFNSTQINVSELSAGIYFLNLVSSCGTRTIRFIKD